MTISIEQRQEAISNIIPEGKIQESITVLYYYFIENSQKV